MADNPSLGGPTVPNRGFGGNNAFSGNKAFGGNDNPYGIQKESMPKPDVLPPTPVSTVPATSPDPVAPADTQPSVNPLENPPAPSAPAPAEEKIYRPLDQQDIVSPDVQAERTSSGPTEPYYASPEQAFDTAVRTRKGDMLYALTQVMGVDSETASRVQQLANNHGLPFDVAEANQKDLENYDKALKVYSHLFDQDANGNDLYPGTIRWMQNPDQMRAVKDDIQAVTEIETAMRQQKQISEGVIKQSLRSFGSGTLRVGADAANLLPNLVEGKRAEQIAAWGASVYKPYNPNGLLESLAGKLNQWSEGIAPAHKTGDIVGEFRKGPLSGIGETWYQGLDLAPTLIAYLAAPERAALPFAYGQGLENANRMDKFSGKSEVDRANNAKIQGAIQLALAKFGARDMVDKWTEAYRLANNAPLTNGMVAKGLMAALAGEAALGAATQGGADYADYLTGNPKALDNLGSDMANMALLNAATATTLSVFPLRNAMKQMRQQEVGKKAWEAVAKVAEKSKLDRKTLGDAATQFAEENGVPAEGYITLNQLRDAINQSQVPEGGQVTPDIQAKTETIITQIAKDMGIEADVEAAKKSPVDSDVVLPIGKFATAYSGTPIGEKVLPWLRLEQDGPMLKDGREWLDQRKSELLTELAKVQSNITLHDSAKAIYEGLQEHGQKADVAMANALAFNEMAKIQAEREGLSLDEYYKQLDVKVTKEGNKTVIHLNRPSLFGKLMGETGGKIAMDQTVRGKISSSDGKTLITLLKNADASTFMHEGFHFFEAQLRALADAGKASKSVMDDLAAMQDFVKEFKNETELAKAYETLRNENLFQNRNFSSLSAQEKNTIADIAGREKLARAFEAYLREGTAPSTRLVNAFRTFKKWLTRLYANFANLNVEINPSIRDVFDRMLASEKDIRNAEAYYGTYDEVAKALEAPVKPDAADPEQANKSLEELRMARSAAEDKAREDQTKMYLKAYLEAINGKQTLRDQATREINDLPVIKAIDLGHQMKIGLDNLAIVLGDETVKALKEKYPKMFTAKGEGSIEELAAKSGYEDPMQLVRELLDTPSKQELITARTENLLAIAEDNIRRDLILQEVSPADEATHNKQSAEYLAAQIQVLENKLEKDQMAARAKFDRKAVTNAAIDTLHGMKLTDAIRPGKYLRQEQNLMRKALAAAKKGDWNQVLEIRKQQYLLHIQATEAIKLKQQIKAIESKYTERKISKALENVENDFNQPIKAMLYALGLSDKKPEVLTIDANRLQELDDSLAEMLPMWARSQSGLESVQRDYRKNLTYDQFMDAHNWINSAFGLGRDLLLSLKEERLTTLSQWRAEAIRVLGESRQRVDQLKREGSTSARLEAGYRNMANSALHIASYMLDKFDNFSFLKTGKRGLWGTLAARASEGDANKIRMKRLSFDLINQALMGFHKTARAIEKKYGANRRGFFDIPGVPVPEQMKQIGHNQWSMERVISILMCYGDYYYRNGLQETLGITPEHVNILASHFSKDELMRLQKIGDAINVFAKPLDDVFFNIYNRHLKLVESEPFKLRASDGSEVELKGWYYPYMADPKLSGTSARKNEQQEMSITNQTMFANSYLRRNMTKERTGKFEPPRLDFNVLTDHLEMVSHYIAFAELTRDMDRITLDPEIRNALTNAQGRDRYEFLRSWVSDLKSKDIAKGPSIINNMANWLRARGSEAALTWKFTTGLAQRTAVLNGISELGAGEDHPTAEGLKWLMKGFAATATDRGGVGALVYGAKAGHAFEFMMEHSSFVPAREDSINTELHVLFDVLKLQKIGIDIGGRRFTSKDLREFGYEWIKANDRAVITPLWTGAYLKMMDKNQGKLSEDAAHAEAVKYADSIIEKTQPSALYSDLTEMQRSRDPLIKMLTMYMSWAVKLGNRVTHQYDAWNQGQITNKQFFHHFTHEVLFEPMINVAMRSALRGIAAPWWMILTAPFMSYLSWIPFMDSIVRQGGQYLADEKHGSAKDALGRALGTPFGDAADLIGSGIDDVRKITEGRADYTRTLWDLMKLTTFGMGVHPENLVQEILTTYDRITDSDVSKSVTGRSVKKP